MIPSYKQTITQKIIQAFSLVPKMFLFIEENVGFKCCLDSHKRQFKHIKKLNYNTYTI